MTTALGWLVGHAASISSIRGFSTLQQNCG
jgi:hypothetical protein